MEAEELLKRYELVKKYTEGERDFIAINLNEANLSRINLSQANLSNASLFVTNLSGANLSEINLTGANLNVARLSSTNLVRAILNGATLNVANLVRADLTEAQLIGAALIRGELIRAELSKANFSKANLTGADLREAKLTQVNFSQANLSGANLRGVSGTGANFEMVNLHGSDLTKADLNGADLSGADLRQANLSLVNFSGTNLSGANLRWADLSGANLSSADLNEAKLSGANLYGANLTNANLANASLVHTDLTVANLIGADWVGADLSGSTLSGAKLYDVPRFGIKAEEITCDWVDLSFNGDNSQIFRFGSPEESKKFFNHTPPTVKIIVDSTLEHEANCFLATTYQQIAQYYPVVYRPPSIEAGYRKTTITFIIDSDEHLLPTGCIAILPFVDAVTTQKNLIALARNLQLQNIEKKRIVQLCTAMNEGINKLNDLKKMLPFLNNEQKNKFFHAPTQTILKNSSEQNLTVQFNPNFGKRFLNSHPHKFTLPNTNKFVEFIESFYYLN
ncbi:MAG TPA: pentapeptide repeat-containing protein [Kamptonema sp.]|nr:pentapeptide repeat-containing protein [Kamptonema sp.]